METQGRNSDGFWIKEGKGPRAHGRVRGERQRTKGSEATERVVLKREQRQEDLCSMEGQKSP